MSVGQGDPVCARCDLKSRPFQVHRVFITGTPGVRDWYANLIANPEFRFHLKESAKIDLPARATPITDPEERKRVMSAPETEWYRGQATMDQLVAGSPMVEVHFE